MKFRVNAFSNVGDSTFQRNHNLILQQGVNLCHGQCKRACFLRKPSLIIPIFGMVVPFEK
jgi:hypothetical protein